MLPNSPIKIVVLLVILSGEKGWVDIKYFNKKCNAACQCYIVLLKKSTPILFFRYKEKKKKKSNDKISFIITGGFGKMQKNDSLDLLFVKNVF